MLKAIYIHKNIKEQSLVWFMMIGHAPLGQAQSKITTHSTLFIYIQFESIP